MGLIKKINDLIESSRDTQIADKLFSYLDFLCIPAEIDLGMHLWDGDGRPIIAHLENSNIDGLTYFTREEDSRGPQIIYAVECETGNKRKELRANTKKIKEGTIFRKTVDFKWVGGQIADILNQDTELKEPLYDELNIPQPKEFDESSWTGKYRNIDGLTYFTRNEDVLHGFSQGPQSIGLDIPHPKEFDESSWTGRYRNIKRSGDIRIIPFDECVTIQAPLNEWTKDSEPAFPPPHVFKAYDTIAKYIREYAHY